MVVIYRAPGTGKNFVSLDLALHIAAGRRWADRLVRQAWVVYVAAEGGFGLRKRIVAAIAHHGIDRTVPFALVTAAPKLGTASGDADALVAAIRKQTARFSVKPGLVVLDTLARSMTGSDESNAAGMGHFIATVEEIGRQLDAVIVPVHHAGKDPAAGMRGSSALNGAADGVWRVERDGPRKTITIEKSKDDQDGEVLPFGLVRRELGVDDDGEPITTCVVDLETDDAPPSGGVPAAATVSGQREAVLSALRRAIAIEGRPSRNRVIPVGMTVISKSKLWPFLEPIGLGTSSKKSLDATLNRHLRDLEEIKMIERHDDWIWLLAPVENEDSTVV
ncbi:AAA family ATPase [Lichenifustis flavocetrariae]|uniref:Helicase RepA family protein n=1 Tax=Lichenifustis flavocetrariae TaxID=2949735 RepID=A0AA42CPP3_9HYPH|nr:AAA family ATPase [Lichenifustis flavocetrariae]MCW6510622.1 helicase RepA family protein [Lichenifustis flavocetrariae]